MSRLRVFVLVALIRVVSSSVIQRHSVYRYGNDFFIGNQTYNKNNVGKMLLKEDCVGAPYVHIAKRVGCFPVYIQSKLCAGYCLSVRFPERVKVDSRYKGKCTACTPTKFVDKRIFMLCKTKLEEVRKYSGKYHVFQIVTKVIEECSCLELKCRTNAWKTNN